MRPTAVPHGFPASTAAIRLRSIAAELCRISRLGWGRPVPILNFGNFDMFSFRPKASPIVDKASALGRDAPATVARKGHSTFVRSAIDAFAWLNLKTAVSRLKNVRWTLTQAQIEADPQENGRTWSALSGRELSMRLAPGALPPSTMVLGLRPAHESHCEFPKLLRGSFLGS
jgi:hypothetical protein